MKKSTKIALAALACLTVGVGAQVATAPQANAVSSSASDMYNPFPPPAVAGSGRIGTDCNGKLVSSMNANRGGSYTLKLYYSTANNGTLCAKHFNNTPYRHAMSVGLRNTNRWNTDLAFDAGIFSQFAGAVKITNMNNRKCVCAYGSLYYQNGQYYILFNKYYQVRGGVLSYGCL